MAAVGLIVAVAPFVLSLRAPQFSDPAKGVALPIELSPIALGTFKKVEYRGQPVVILRPSNEILADLETISPFVGAATIPLDPSPLLFAYVAVSTSHGCSLSHRPKDANFGSDGTPWVGGWIDPCHYGAWDYAGRPLLRGPNVPPGVVLPGLKPAKYRVVSADRIELVP